MVFKQSHLQELKTQMIEDIVRLEADMLEFGRSGDIFLPCAPEDLEEVEMLLEDLYPNSNYRAVVVEKGLPRGE